MRMHSQVAAITNSSSEAYVAPPFSGGDVWGMIVDEAARLITAGDQEVLEFCGGDAVFLEIGEETRDEQGRIVSVEWRPVPGEVDRGRLEDELRDHMYVDVARNGIILISNMDEWRFPLALAAFFERTFGAAPVEA